MKSIWAVALYEMRHLVRDWFFRIFAILSTIPLVTTSIVFFSSVSPVPWLFRALPSFPPLADLTMLNIGQTAIFVLLAADIFKRERKINTVEVIHIRSLSNFTYLSGKALGIMLLFLLFDLLILLITFIVHAGFSNINLSVMPYLYYILLIPFPAMVFTIGLTFLLMRLVRNQVLAALIIIGLEAVVLIYVRSKFHGAFDFVGTHLPFVYSHLSGFNDLKLLLFQRMAFFFSGVSTFLLAVRFFFRLPQSRVWQRLIWPMIFITGGAAGFCGWQFTMHFSDEKQFRDQYLAISQAYQNQQPSGIESCDINVIHTGDRLRVTAAYSGLNIQSGSDSLLFSLNPGMHVQAVRIDGREVTYNRSMHILLIPLAAKCRSIEITYDGVIDERVAFPDVDDEERYEQDFMWLYRAGKHVAFLQPDYVLLTPEVLWYPQPGLPVALDNSHNSQPFLNFSLNVQTDADLMAISQGKSATLNEGHFSFLPEQPLAGLSLIIGDYTQRSIVVDSLEYSVFTSGKSETFETAFTEIGDTLSPVIRELRQDYERKLNLEYPFKRLSLVEVPLHFHAYQRTWSATTEWVQPEQVWLPENGAVLASYDFKRMDERFNDRFESRNQTYTDKEVQTLILQRFIKNTLLSARGWPMDYPPGLVTSKRNNALFGNYYSHVISMNSEERSVFAAALEGYLYERSIEKEQRRFWRSEGLSSTEKVSKALSVRSVAAILDSSDDRELKANVIRLKGEYLFKTISGAIGQEAFEAFWSEFVRNHRFQTVRADQWIGELEKRFDVDLKTFLDLWFNSEALPGFRTENLQMYQVMDGDRLRYQVQFEIFNPESIDGLFEVQFMSGGGFRGMRGMGQNSEDEPPRTYQLAGKQRKRIGIVLNEEPRRLTINSLIAKNIPIVDSRRFAKSSLREKAVPFEGEKVIPFDADNPLFQELIIDNADTAFSVSKSQYSSWLKQWLYSGQEKSEEEFDNFRFWHPPNQWRLIKDASYYGIYVHSAYYIRPGSGERFAEWRAHLPAKGNYDVYAYMFERRRFQGRRNRSAVFADFQYHVYHDDGTDEIEVDVNKSENGWVYLGTYYFSKDNAKVRLSDKTEGRVVIADAVRFVKH